MIDVEGFPQSVYKRRHYIIFAVIILIIMIIAGKIVWEVVPKPVPTPIPTPALFTNLESDNWPAFTSSRHNYSLKLPESWPIFKGSLEDNEVGWMGEGGSQFIVQVELTTFTSITDYVQDLDRRRATAFAQGTKSIEVLSSITTIVDNKGAVKRKERFLGSTDPNHNVYVTYGSKVYHFQFIVNDNKTYGDQFENILDVILSTVKFG